jgi:hypothetical protein
MTSRRAGLWFLIGLAAAVGACAGPAEEEVGSGGSAVGEDPLAAAGFVMHVQEPLSVRPGTAVRSTQLESGKHGAAEALPARCVEGAPNSLLEMMRRLGHAGLGGTSTFSVGRLASGPAFAGAPRMVIEQESFRAPPPPLPSVASFLGAVGADESRVSGSVEARVDRNSFSLSDPKRTRDGDSCGTHWVQSVKARRFISYAIALDFPSPTEASEYRAQFPLGVNAILDPTPALSASLKDSAAKLTFHVLVAKELADIVKKSVAGDACTIDQLAGCRKAFDHLLEVAKTIGDLPGNDETLEAVVAPGSTWGLYDATYASYVTLPDLP